MDLAPVRDWRQQGRLDDLRRLVQGAANLTWSHGLLRTLLEELHISDDFDVLVGRVGRVSATQYPRLLAIAVLLRHSWCQDDLERTAARLGLQAITTSLTPSPTYTGNARPGAHRSDGDSVRTRSGASRRRSLRSPLRGLDPPSACPSKGSYRSGEGSRRRENVDD